MVIDPTLPHVEVAAVDERSMRYTLHLDRSHQVWKEQIGRPLSAGRG